MVSVSYRQPLYDTHVARIRIALNGVENVIVHFYPDSDDTTPAWSWGFASLAQWEEFVATVAAFDMQLHDVTSR